MFTGISTKEEVLNWFIRYTDNQYQDADDQEYVNKLIRIADELISDDVDYWANESVRKLHDTVRERV
jgi:hypothetical protein